MMKNKKEKIEEEYKGSYYMDYHCRNCGNFFTQVVEYGTRAVQGICPRCGVDDSGRNLDDTFRDF